MSRSALSQFGPRGLYVLGDATTSSLLGEPFISGFVLRIPWSELEPSPGAYDFGAIDAALLALEQSGQKLTLEMFTTVVAPQVLATFGATWTDFRDRVNGVPWDEAQLEAWDDLVAALAAHRVTRLDGSSVELADHPNLETVNAPIAGLQDVRDISEQLVLHPDYERERLLNAVLASVRSVRERFPDQFSFVGMFRMPDQDPTPPLDEALLEALLDEFVRGQTTPLLGFFQENLADTTPDPATGGLLLSRAAAETFIMLQALTPWVDPFPQFEARVPSGSPFVGLNFGSTSYGAHYFELYESDLQPRAFKGAFRRWSDCLMTTGPCP